ncbi:MAG: class I SAM-dependent methyltransferase [Chthoniobacteraceae bacterium]
MHDAHSPSLGGKAPLSAPDREPAFGIPLAIEQIDTVLRLLSAGGGQIRRFLDLGRNDGVLSATILSEYPHAEGVVIEREDRPLQTARGHLHAHASQLDFILADIRSPEWMSNLTDREPFDAVVAGFAAQDLLPRRKRELCAEILQLLKPGGVFVLIEHVASATRWTEEILDDYMIQAVFGEQLRKSVGKPRAQVARDFFASDAGETFQTAPLEVQCDWLMEVGFQSVDCYLKVSEMAVFGGQKPDAPNPTP